MKGFPGVDLLKRQTIRWLGRLIKTSGKRQNGKLVLRNENLLPISSKVILETPITSGKLSATALRKILLLRREHNYSRDDKTVAEEFNNFLVSAGQNTVNKIKSLAIEHCYSTIFTSIVSHLDNTPYPSSFPLVVPTVRKYQRLL